MDDEQRKMLEKLLELADKNHQILRKMRREAVVAKFFHAVYWILILAIALVSYYYIQPYIVRARAAFDTVEKFKSLTLPR